MRSSKSGRNAYLVAAAARALRGRESRGSDAVPFLLKAIANITYADDAVSFDSYRPAGRYPDTPRHCRRSHDPRLSRERGDVALPALRSLLEEPGVLSEAARVKLESGISELSVSGSCCAVPAASPCCSHHTETARPVIHQIHPILEPTRPPASSWKTRTAIGDVQGVLHRQTLGGGVLLHALRQPQQVLAHDHQAGRLQGRLADLGLDGRIQTAAITYDPEFDLPARLRAYGENRGVVFSPSARIFRTRGALAAVEDYFELGVSFGETLVNRHRIELFLLDQRCGGRELLPGCSGTSKRCSLRRRAS